ncbi:hypothetical protein [uncultured Methanobrevibacter sp.]|uniref:hypothetical protein n=1 Tax=uncultured Methanobrevibacter sp. TaxID=253161 RepID=UPI0025E99337|nr:hypothetical protein [uncultured Methanobrevibacter sp.]
MDLSKKIFAILAIFCVLASAGAVCATDNFGYADDMGGYIGSDYSDNVGYAADDSGYAVNNYQDDTGYAADDSGYAGSNYQDDTGYAADDSGYAGSQYNETLENATANAAGEPTNATNTTAQAAGEPVNETNATAGTTHTMLATGNPILILLAVIAVLGGYAAFKRK